MHEYYAKNAPKLKKAMNGFFKPITSELEQHSGKSYAVLFEEIWDQDRKSTRLNSSHTDSSRMPSSA